MPWPLISFKETVTSPTVFWAAIASMVGIIALCGFYEQLAVTQVATKETKRSVDMYIASERGVMWHYKSAIKDDKDEMNFCFKNVGRGPVVIMGIAGIARIHQKKFPPSIEMGPIHELAFVVEPQGFISTYNDPQDRFKSNLANLALPITKEDRVLLSSKEYLIVIQYLVRYRSIMDTYHELRQTIYFDPSTRAYAEKMGDGYSHHFQTDSDWVELYQRRATLFGNLRS